MITAPSTPASAHSRMIPGTDGAGETITASSTREGTSEMEGYALMPSTLGLREFTGKTVPPNGLLTRFHMIVRPTLPGRSVAPMTATVSGRKMVSNCCRSYPRTSWAGSALLDRFIGRSFVALGLQASGFRLQFILV